MFLRLMTIVFVVIVCIILISQIIYPSFFGKQYFWLFRKSQKKLCNQNQRLAELEETKKIIKNEKEIKKMEESLKKDINNTLNKSHISIKFEDDIPPMDNTKEKTDL